MLKEERPVSAVTDRSPLSVTSVQSVVDFPAPGQGRIKENALLLAGFRLVPLGAE
jgi:hypothetical protein